MKKAVNCGLVLLAAIATHSAPALGYDSAAEAAAGGAAAQFYVGSSGAATVRATQGYLGVDERDVTADQVSVLKLKECRGAEIVFVDHDAPAGKAGLREHDVVLQMNGQAIEGQDQLRRMLHDSPPGKTVTLIISRYGQQMTISTQMSTQEEVNRQAWEEHIAGSESSTSDSSDPIVSSGATSSSSLRAGNSFIGTLLMNPSYTGAILEKMSTQLAGYFGVSSGAGLLVRSVVANSPAAAAGMHAGDVVLRANEHAVTTTNDWAKAVKNSRGQLFTIVVLRDKKEQTLTLTLDGKKHSSLEPPARDADRFSVARLGLSWMPRS